jgi:hypothetical protein
MCTMIVHQASIAGCGKGQQGWFDVNQVNVTYDHPFHAPMEHALNLDFVNEAQGPGARVALELTPESARQLVQAILATLKEAESKGHVETSEHAHVHAHAH